VRLTCYLIHLAPIETSMQRRKVYLRGDSGPSNFMEEKCGTFDHRTHIFVPNAFHDQIHADFKNVVRFFEPHLQYINQVEDSLLEVNTSRNY